MGGVIVVWERTSSRIWIVQADHRRQNGQPEWRYRRRVLVQIHPDEVISDSAARTYGHLAVACWIPCNAGAGFQVFPLAFHSGFTVEAGIAGIIEAWGSARNRRAP